MRMPSWLADRRRALLLVVLAWVISRAAIFICEGPARSDIELYFRYAVQGVDEHKVAYRDFDVEYPPAAYWFMTLPRLVDPHPVPEGTFDGVLGKSPAFMRYGHLYELMALACDLAAFVLLLDMARRHWPAHLVPLAAGYVAATAVLWPVLLQRLDIALTAILLAWAWLWLRAGDGGGAAGRYRNAAHAMLGLGVSFKLVPVLMVPFVLLAELRSSRPWRQTAQALVALAVSAGLPFAIHLASAGSSVGRMFAYHGQRGIQIESLYASVLALVTSEPLDFEVSFGSVNVATDWTAALKTCSTLLLLALLAGLGLWSLLQGARYTRSQALSAACLALCGATILAKVLSPQYFLWALPVAMLLGAQTLPPKWQYSWLLAAVLVGLARTTTWIFPDHYRELVDAQLGHTAWMVLAARNLAYLGLVAGLGARLLLIRQAEPALNVPPHWVPDAAHRPAPHDRQTGRAAA